MNITRTRRLAGLMFALVLSALTAVQAQAAPASSFTQAPIARPAENHCVPHKQIDTWSNRRAIEARGFNFDVVGPQASALFQRDLSLNLTSDPDSKAYTASRMTEIDSHLPIAKRVKCWQATPDKNVVVEFRVRFQQPDGPEHLTENLELWNAPFPSFDSATSPAETSLPLTSIGVARTSALSPGDSQYLATVVQDLNVNTYEGLISAAPMPEWLLPNDWHRVRLTISQQAARIEVAQGQHQFETVLDQVLNHPAEPLGFEFSVDNEASPISYEPVTAPDGIEIDYLSMSMVRAH